MQYYEYGALKFWRHLAAEFAFVAIGSKWFLQITPKYLFTDDGKKPWHPDLVGPYTTSLKAKEHNIQVLNHVLFWAHILSDSKPAIEMALFGVSGLSEVGYGWDPTVGDSSTHVLLWNGTAAIAVI